MTVLACRRCGSTFERKRRGPSPKYCEPCRPEVNREKTRERKAAIESELMAKRDTLRGILEPLRDQLSTDMILTAEQYIDSLEGDSVVAIVEDRMPAGSMTPAGSDDGTSTSYQDLAALLAQRRAEAAAHPWHLEHPGWWETE